MSLRREFTKGIVRQNPIFMMLLGMCPVLAVSTSVENGLGMGIASTSVLVASNFVVSSVRRIIPENIRIPCFIVIIATFVTMTELIIKAYAPALDASLGIFIPLIVVNCIILGRAEAFASKNGIIRSVLDGLGMGLGFTFGLCILSAFREVLGTGKLFGIQLFGEAFSPALIMILPPGAFITLGCLLGVIFKLQQRSRHPMEGK